MQLCTMQYAAHNGRGHRNGFCEQITFTAAVTDGFAYANRCLGH